MRRKQSSAVLPIIAVVMIGVFLVAVYFSAFGPFPTLQIIPMGLGQPAPTPTPLTFEAEQIVSRMYDALTNNSDLDYLHTLPMASRGKIRPERILSGIIEQSRVQLYPLEIPLEYLDQVAYSDMAYSGNWQRDGYVLVHARGLAYLAALKAEYQMCDVWDVHRYEDGWFVDVDAPERSARLQYLANRRLQEEDPELAGLPFGLGSLVKQLTTSPEDNIRMILNTCE